MRFNNKKEIESNDLIIGRLYKAIIKYNGDEIFFIFNKLNHEIIYFHRYVINKKEYYKNGLVLNKDCTFYKISEKEREIFNQIEQDNLPF